MVGVIAARGTGLTTVETHETLLAG
jgi:hypothetical protein